MRICIVLNPNSGTARQASAVLERARRNPDVVVWETQEAGDAERLAAKAAAEGFDIVAAAGGDGTVHEVANGLLADELPASRLGLIPLGTGNDLARTLGIPLDPPKAYDLLFTGNTEPLDAIRVSTDHGERYVVNAAAGGFSGQVDEVLNAGVKGQWGPLAYLLGAVAVLPDLTGYRTCLSYDGGDFEVLDAINIIVANGRTVAGGKRVASPANPQDGLMDVVVVRNGTVLVLATVAARLLAGDYIESDMVEHRRAKSLCVSSTPGMWFNADGELWTQETATFTVQPSALQAIVGPGFVAEPAAAVKTNGAPRQ